MALTLTVNWGPQLQPGVRITESSINALVTQAVFQLEGTISATAIPDGGVTTVKLADGAVTNVKIAASTITQDRIAADSRQASLVAACRNLVIKNNAGTPNTKIDIAADEVVLKNVSGGAYLASAVSLTVDITAGGANGIDAGAAAASTWYYVWLIYNGTTVASLLSTSATLPTLPAGYTHYALIGAARMDASTHFIGFWQHDRKIFIVAQNLLSNQTAAVANTYETLAGGNLTTFQGIVPPMAKSFFGNLGGSVTGATTNTWAAVAANAAGLGESRVIVNNTSTAGDSFFGAGRFECPLLTSQNFYWKSLVTASHVRIDVSGYNI